MVQSKLPEASVSRVARAAEVATTAAAAPAAASAKPELSNETRESLNEQASVTFGCGVSARVQRLRRLG